MGLNARRYFWLKPTYSVTVHRLARMLKTCVYCKFGNFRENFVFANSIKRHICNVKNSRLGQDLSWSVNDRMISLFREGFIFIYAKFLENKPSRNFRIYSSKNNWYNYSFQRAIVNFANQTMRMCKLGCAFVVRMQLGQVFSRHGPSRPPNNPIYEINQVSLQ